MKKRVLSQYLAQLLVNSLQVCAEGNAKNDAINFCCMYESHFQ